MSEVDAAEAEIVRLVYDNYTVEGLSIGAIARLLREKGVPTRRRVTRWERSVIWAILRNPAYKGTACFNKTQSGPRQKVTKPFRLSGRAVHGEKSSSHERPRDEWIEIPVPPIVSEETFALAAERLADNKRFAPRRTIEPSIVQGLVSCRKCGYALSRTSTRSSARKIHYYRCLGSDAWRHLGGAVCDNRPVRQDLLDEIVWREVSRLIEEPTLIQTELDRRLEAARAAEPTKRRQEVLDHELTRIDKSMERLLTAYQEDLLSLEELRHRMPELRARQQNARAELQSILDQTADRISLLRLAETLTAFLQRLRDSAATLEVSERQKIVRLLVKEVLVDDHTITIRHSIPAQPTPPTSRAPLHSDWKFSRAEKSYLLRSGSAPSPALANLYFRRFALAWRDHGHQDQLNAHVVNYADDFVICCRPGNAEEAMMRMQTLMTRLGLEVNETKTRIARLPEDGFTFLGYTIGRFFGKDGRAYLGTRPSRKAVKSLLRRIHASTTPRWHRDAPKTRWSGSIASCAVGAATSIKGRSCRRMTLSADTSIADCDTG